MPVLCEALSLILKRTAIDRRYPGGFSAFEATAPYIGPGIDTFCADDDGVVRVGFTNSTDMRPFGERLERLGFRPKSDMVIVSARTGPTQECDWLELVRYRVDGGVVLGARMKGSTSRPLMVPFKWTWANSLTKNARWAPDSVLDTAEFVGTTRDGLDVFRDEVTGQLRYLWRAFTLSQPGDVSRFTQ